MFAQLQQAIRRMTRSTAVLVAIVALSLAFAGGWALAGFAPGHHTNNGAALTSAHVEAQHTAASSQGAGVPTNGAGAPQGQSGLNLPLLALGPDGSSKPRHGSGKRNSTPCPPPPGTTVTGGLLVDGTCVVTGVTINGGVVITGTGHLTLYRSTVNGGTSVRPGGEFDSDNPPIAAGGNQLNGGVSESHGFDLDIFNSVVSGGVLLDGGPTGVGFQFEICGTTIHGDLRLENLGSGGAEIGDTNVVACRVNSISGSVHIINDATSAVELEKVTIGGSVEIWSSKPSLTGDSIGGSLMCHRGASLGHYDGDDTNTNNQVRGTNTCA